MRTLPSRNISFPPLCMKKPNTPYLVQGMLRRKRKGSNWTKLSFRTKAKAEKWVSQQEKFHYYLRITYAPIVKRKERRQDGTTCENFYHYFNDMGIPTLVSPNPVS